LIKLLGRSGHNLSSNAVRAELIPEAVNKRAIYMQLFEADKKTIKEEYNKLIEYFDKAKMTVIENTNNMSWQIIKDTIPLDGFISPSDIITKNHKFSYGYTAEIYFLNKYGKIEQLSPLKYAFDYYSGILTFNPEVSYEELKSYTELYFTGFRYTGKFVDVYMTEL
jgi:FPC/CPF motif-containing protein YcgG